jgi:hypothetical protein
MNFSSDAFAKANTYLISSFAKANTYLIPSFAKANTYLIPSFAKANTYLIPSFAKANKSFKLTLAAALSLTIFTAHAAIKVVDFSDGGQSVIAFVRMRGDTTGADTVTYWKGSAFAVLPGQAPQRIFGFEGFNVARMTKKADGSWRMLSREYAVYRDPKTNAILKTWTNPFTEQTNVVFHVQNDPVNQTFGRKDEAGKIYPMPFTVMGADVQLGFDIPISYPNPIDPKAFPRHAHSALYTGSEHFGFFAKKADFDNAKLSSVPVGISWARTSPWLPWMEMGDKAGYMLFSAWGKKLGSVEEMSADLLAHIKKEQPKFLTAPRDDMQPNATTWSEYKKRVLEPAADLKK